MIMTKVGFRFFDATFDLLVETSFPSPDQVAGQGGNRDWGEREEEEHCGRGGGGGGDKTPQCSLNNQVKGDKFMLVTIGWYEDELYNTVSLIKLKVVVSG